MFWVSFHKLAKVKLTFSLKSFHWRQSFSDIITRNIFEDWRFWSHPQPKSYERWSSEVAISLVWSGGHCHHNHHHNEQARHHVEQEDHCHMKGYCLGGELLILPQNWASAKFGEAKFGRKNQSCEKWIGIHREYMHFKIQCLFSFWKNNTMSGAPVKY